MEIEYVQELDTDVETPKSGGIIIVLKGKRFEICEATAISLAIKLVKATVNSGGSDE